MSVQRVPTELAPMTPAPGAVTPALPLGANTPMYRGGEVTPMPVGAATPMPGGRDTPKGDDKDVAVGAQTPLSGEASATSEGASGVKTPASAASAEAGLT